MCSMGGGGAAWWKVMWGLMVAMLPGFVEAGELVRVACLSFGNGLAVQPFEFGCGVACGKDYPTGACLPATELTPWECDNKCVRHHPHVLLAPPASPTAALRVRFPTWCCTRSFVC